MPCHALFIGINHYQDVAIPTLLGAERDAEELYALFKHGLGYGERAHRLQSPTPDRVFDEIERIRATVHAGDTFVFYFAGHGFELPGGGDQLLLTGAARWRHLNSDSSAKPGVVSVGTLVDELAGWEGVSSVLLFDACRLELEAPNRSAPVATAAIPVFGSEKVLEDILARDPFPRRSKPEAVALSKAGRQPVVIKACLSRQRAFELPSRQRSIFSLALGEVMQQAASTGQAVQTNGGLLVALAERMHRLARDAGLAADQHPWMNQDADEVPLFVPAGRTAASTMSASSAPGGPAAAATLDQVLGLGATFSRQLQAGQWTRPLQDCCVGTLALMRQAGVPETILKSYERQLEHAQEQEAEAGRQTSEAERARREEEQRARDRAAEQARLEAEAAEERRRQADAEQAARVAAEAEAEARRVAQEEAARRERENEAVEAAWKARREAEERQRAEAEQARAAREQQRLAELSAWNHAELQKSIPAYEEFLRLWPHGAHAQQARARIVELRKAADARAQAEADERAKAKAEEARQAAFREEEERERQRQAEELSAWNFAEFLKTVAAYEEYLRLWPVGAHAEEARARIARMRKATTSAGRPEAPGPPVAAGWRGTSVKARQILLVMGAGVLGLGGIAKFASSFGKKEPDPKPTPVIVLPAPTPAQQQVPVTPAQMQILLAWDTKPRTDTWDKRASLPELMRLAEAGHPLAMGLVGNAYDLGLAGVTKDEVRASEWYRRGAMAGDSRSMNNLGTRFLHGLGGLAKDGAKAVEWYRKGAEAGSGAAMANLGDMFEGGRGGLARDDVKAVEWYRKGAEAGNSWAMANLGEMFEGGRGGLAKDDAKAVKWYRKGAEAGSGAAMANLGIMFQHGRGGLTKDDAKAVEWYRKGAEAGDGAAMANLGIMFQHGRGGLAKDDVKAVEWYRKGAEAGNGTAMAGLGIMFQNGIGGLPQDEAKAVEWYRKGAEAGDESARQHLTRLTQVSHSPRATEACREIVTTAQVAGETPRRYLEKWCRTGDSTMRMVSRSPAP